MRTVQFKRRLAGTAAALSLASTLGACSDLLEVTNPGAISESTPDDPKMVVELLNSPLGEFQRMYTANAYWGGLLSDEFVNGHNYFQRKEFDLRQFDEKNSQLTEVYNPVQRARALGEDIVKRVEEAVGSSVNSDIRFAEALAYTGYANVVLGETFCYAPVSPDEDAILSDAIIERAIPYFERAIQVAEAYKTQTANPNVAKADQVINLARVGGARAALQVGNNAKAISFAKDVPADFVAWIRHSDSKSYLENFFYGATTGSTHHVGVDEPFRGLNDPRIRYNPTGRKGHNQETILYTPYQSSSYSDWTADGEDQPFTKTASIRLASGLEARYILAEAGGMTDAELRAFIDERRAVGNQGPYAGADLQAELRDQRRRDFFMDGHRLGDLRRYKARYGIDLFPKGEHPTPNWGEYGTMECYIPHFNERVGNPNYKYRP
jgi:hypothetical protein